VRFLLDGSLNVRFSLNDRAVFCLPQLCFWLSECDVLQKAKWLQSVQQQTEWNFCHSDTLNYPGVRGCYNPP